MEIQYKRSLITTIMFGVLFVFLCFYFGVIGPTHFLDSKLHMLITSSVIGLFMLSFAIMLLMTNKRENVVDERDLLIQRKSTSVGLMVTAIYVFLLCIVVFVQNRNIGTVPVSWMWFLAYSTFSFAYFISSFLIVYLYNIEE